MSNCPTPKDYSKKVWCFQCGNEYFPEVTECIECGVSTTTQKPPEITMLGEEGKENLAYDFHEWTGEARSLLENLLSGANIVHVWQGATLVTQVLDEEKVDTFINEVDMAFRPSLDPEAEKIEYELKDLSDPEVSSLTKTLESEEIPFEISEAGDLLIQVTDESSVEGIFDKLTQDGEHVFGEVEDADVPYILSELLGLCNKLETDAALTTADLIEGKKALDLVVELSLPFGFSADNWQQIIQKSLAVADIFLYVSLEDGISEELKESATQLKAVLPELL